MKCIVILLLSLSLAFADPVAERTYVSTPKPERGLLFKIHIPVTFGDINTLQILAVPARTYGRFPDSIPETLSSPCYAMSPQAKDRQEDINWVSLAHISLRWQQRDDDAERFTLLIDLSRAREPLNAKVSLEDIVQAILTCIRTDCPPDLRAIDVKIAGNNIGAEFKRMEGPLWHTKAKAGN